MMELREFVKDTLLAITEGILEAQKEVPSPETQFGSGSAILGKERIVEFDVALAETESTEKGGKIGVAFPILGQVTGGADKSTGTTSTTRIKFEVPVIYPGHKRSSVSAAQLRL
jgi:hypothetical protein